MGAYYYVIMKMIVQNESGKSIPTRGPLTIYHPSACVTVWSKNACTLVVVLIFQLVEQCDSDVFCEGPWQGVIIFPFMR